MIGRSSLIDLFDCYCRFTVVWIDNAGKSILKHHFHQSSDSLLSMGSKTDQQVKWNELTLEWSCKSKCLLLYPPLGVYCGRCLVSIDWYGHSDMKWFHTITNALPFSFASHPLLLATLPSGCYQRSTYVIRRLIIEYAQPRVHVYYLPPLAALAEVPRANEFTFTCKFSSPYGTTQRFLLSLTV
jgi:hypothetical protein